MQMKSLVMVKAFGPFSLGCRITCCESIHFHRSTSHIVCYESRTQLCSPTSTSHTAMSLLQDVLRNQTLDSIERRFDTTQPDSDNSDDELVNVVRPPVFGVSTSQANSSRRCPYRVHLHYPVQRPGRDRHHRERPRDPALVDCPPTLVETPSGHFLHTSLRGFLDFWTFRILQGVPGCARSGVQVNLSTMVGSLCFLGFLLLIVAQYGFDGIARRILMTKVSPLGSGPDGNRSKTGYAPPPCFLLTR